MHGEHDIFVQGIEQKRRLELTFFSRGHGRTLVTPCAPLYYSKGRDEADGLDCYYLWDFEAIRGSHFLALFPSQIVGMELTEGVFSVEDLSRLSKATEKSAKARHTKSL
ncbi:MAG: hypothetical protein ACYSYV_05875 [Planctomycetota bacterium]|jgi:hypothetical protein